MKASYLTCALAAALASASCNAQNGNDSSSAQAQSELPAVPRPADGDWSKVVIQTPEGGFLMGDPRAKVRLVEFGSMTCPHCAEFDETGVQPLIDKYVKTGQVSYEFRNYVRDPFDMAASLIGRCNGTTSFFPLTRALFHDQRNWVERVQQVPQAQLESLQNLPPNQQFVEIGKMAGFPSFAAMRGVPEAKSAQCLANETEVNRLVQMTADATSQYPQFPGTPSFVINGKLLDRTATWQALEPQLRTALGERG